MSAMSESAAIIKLFFFRHCTNLLAWIHYKRPERRISLLGSKLSADSGAKTKLGPASS